jgi:hypothetical protein
LRILLRLGNPLGSDLHLPDIIYQPSRKMASIVMKGMTTSLLKIDTTADGFQLWPEAE